MAAGAILARARWPGSPRIRARRTVQAIANQADKFSGMIVATVYRLITLAIAGIGLVYYLD